MIRFLIAFLFVCLVILLGVFGRLGSFGFNWCLNSVIIEEIVPNSSLVDEENTVLLYNNGLFDLEVHKEEKVKTNYLTNLFSYFYAEIEKIGIEKDIIIVANDLPMDILYTQMIENPDKSFMSISFSDNFVNFRFYLNDELHCSTCYDFIYTIYETIQPYLPPEKYSQLYFMVSLEFYTKETITDTTRGVWSIMKDKALLISRNLVIGLDERCLRHCYNGVTSRLNG